MEPLERAIELLQSLEYDEFGIPESYPDQIAVIECLEAFYDYQ